jgi:hypothetical protein
VICVVHLPCTVEHDEDGIWCASPRLRPGVGAFGDGPTREAAIADLRAGLDFLPGEIYWPGELAGEGLRPEEGK